MGVSLFLPDSSGLSSLWKIRVDFPHIPVIILSGLNDSEITIRAIKEGAQDYLIKGEISPGILCRSFCYAIERISQDFSERALHESQKELESTKERFIGIAQSLGILLKKEGSNGSPN